MANGEGSQFGQFLMRAGKALAIHFVIGALLFGLGWWATMGFDSASDQLKAQFEEAPDPAIAVQMVLDSLRLKLWGWFGLSMLISWLAASLFIGLAQQNRPGDEIEGARRMPLWIGLLLLTIAASAVLWWRQISLADVGASLMTGGYGLSVALGFVLTVTAYWLATAVSVKKTMRYSVPLWFLLPKRWN